MVYVQGIPLLACVTYSKYITSFEVLEPAFQLPAVQQQTFQYVYLYIQFLNPFSSQWLPESINFKRIKIWGISEKEKQCRTFFVGENFEQKLHT
jgi:hypothetical protein